MGHPPTMHIPFSVGIGEIVHKVMLGCFESCFHLFIVPPGRSNLRHPKKILNASCRMTCGKISHTESHQRHLLLCVLRIFSVCCLVP